MTIQAPTPEQLRDAWDALATGFDENVTPHSMMGGEAVLQRVEIGAGTRFLDIGAGSGALSIPAARRGADVIAVDIAPSMLERLTARARAEGLANIEGRVMDARGLDLVADTVDVSASQNGVTMVPELEQALAEMVRVTRPGGSVLVAAFGPPPKAEFIAFVLGAVKATVPDFAGLPMDPPPPPFKLADPGVFADTFTGVGLTDVSVETITWEFPVESATALWQEFRSSNPIGAQIAAGLTGTQEDGVLEQLDGMLRERSGGEPAAVLHADMNVGTGTV